jgi:hypothetical protein
MRHGFKGLTGFHYYSEPLLYIDRILYLIHLIGGDYVLWTNGSLLTEKSREWLPLFKQVSISLYSQEDADRILPIVRDLPNCQANPAPHDSRIAIYSDGDVNPGGCSRPMSCELPIDCWGDIHLCCSDYNGKIQIGNIITDDHDTIIREFYKAAEFAERGFMPMCWRCRALHSPAIGV